MGSGLGRRLLTAGILIPLAAAAVLELSTARIAALFGLVVLAAAWEWAGLAGWQSGRARAAYAAGTAFLLLLLYPLLDHASRTLVILAGGLCWWLWALYCVVRNQRAGAARLARGRWALAVAGVLILVPAWSALVDLHGQPGRGPVWVLYLLALVWCADIGAFFVGRRWGARPLASRISPGKTWEGAGGALGFAAVAALGSSPYLGAAAPGLLVALSLATVPVSILGDLAESLSKRQVGVKDSGVLVPGHGGVLDRIDSLTAAAPFFVFGIDWMGMTM